MTLRPKEEDEYHYYLGSLNLTGSRVVPTSYRSRDPLKLSHGFPPIAAMALYEKPASQSTLGHQCAACSNNASWTVSSLLLPFRAQRYSWMCARMVSAGIQGYQIQSTLAVGMNIEWFSLHPDSSSRPILCKTGKNYRLAAGRCYCLRRKAKNSPDGATVKADMVSWSRFDIW